MVSRDYEYVSAVAAEGSFSKAAQKLYISQPALSGAIKKIEKDLYGIPLFDRTVTPVVLTEAGRYYLEQTRKIYDISNEIDQHFALLAGVKAGVINIGSSAYFCAFMLPEMIQGYCRMNPRCEINLTETDISGMDAGLRSGQFDVTIDVEKLDSEVFESITLGYEYMIWRCTRFRENGFWIGVFWMRNFCQWSFHWFPISRFSCLRRIRTPTGGVWRYVPMPDLSPGWCSIWTSF